MANPYFQFKQFIAQQNRCAMKVTTDSCLFGAWCAREIQNSELKIQNLLDLGSGTGLLSLMIAQKNKLQIDAVEIDEEAAIQSKENVQTSLWAERIHIFNRDIRIFSPDKKYNCIVSNPPFYENEPASRKEKKNIAHHSRQLTMAQVISIIKKMLGEKGVFFLLLPHKRMTEIEKLIEAEKLFISKKIMVHQSENHKPFRVIVSGSAEKTGTSSVAEIIISDEARNYTEGFINLLKDYYLHL